MAWLGAAALGWFIAVVPILVPLSLAFIALLAATPLPLGIDVWRRARHTAAIRPRLRLLAGAIAWAAVNGVVSCAAFVLARGIAWST